MNSIEAKEWKIINDFPNYMISNYGDIKSIKTNKILKPYITKRGYVYNCLSCNGKTYNLQVHRLVASVFISNALNLTEINHKDENKQNNCVNNLEWCSSLYNKKYGTKNIRAGMAHRKKVIQYTKENMFVKEYASGLEAEKITKIDNASISRCCYNRQETAGGYKWRFSNE